MIQPIIYKAIVQKNILEKEMLSLSSEESLIHCLNVFDLNIALKGELNKDDSDSDDNIEWIKLKLINDQ